MEAVFTLIAIALFGTGVFILIRAIEVGGLKSRLSSLEGQITLLSQRLNERSGQLAALSKAEQESPPEPDQTPQPAMPEPAQVEESPIPPAAETPLEEEITTPPSCSCDIPGAPDEKSAVTTSPAAKTAPEPAEAPVQPTSETASPAPAFSVSLEYFIGAKLFAWLGGFALFLGLCFFVKYSIDNNLVSPELRVALTYAGSLALLIAGFLTRGKKYAILSGTLLATGVLVLYLATCAARLFYEFPSFTTNVTGAALVGTTLLAMTLAIRLRAQVIAILGLVGGFLTPLLLSTGQDHTNTLFCYICLLNAGLIAVIRYTKWHYLSLLGAVFTLTLSIEWAVSFFSAQHFPALFHLSWITLALYSANTFYRTKTKKTALLSLISTGLLIAALSLVILILIIPPGSASLMQRLLLEGEHRISLVWAILLLALPSATHAALGVRHTLARSLFPISSLLHLSCLVLLLDLSHTPPLLTSNPAIFGLALLFGLSHFALGLKFNIKECGEKRKAPLFPTGCPAVSCLLVFILPIALQLGDTLPSGLLLGLTGLFVLPFLGASLIRGKDFFLLMALGGAFLSIHSSCFTAPNLPLTEWSIVPGVALLFLLFPFLLSKHFQTGNLAWKASAAALPLFYTLFRTKLLDSVPDGAVWTGALALTCGLLTLAGALRARKTTPPDSPLRTSRLSLYFAVSLGFLTLFFGEQFEHEYLTVAWALEGAALLWLYHKLPDKKLIWTGSLLLIVAFIRLIFNENILSYHPASKTILLNWYLPVYLLVACSCYTGALLLKKVTALPRPAAAAKLLDALGTILLFALVNLEIADAYSAAGENTLTFHFGTSLACDLTYSIAWGIFALCLLVFGLCKKARSARLCGLWLLIATMFKVFFYDLSALEQLYRVGALVGLALIALAASFLYQRYNARHSGNASLPPP